jgi:hypothetical protein
MSLDQSPDYNNNASDVLGRDDFGTDAPESNNPHYVDPEAIMVRLRRATQEEGLLLRLKRRFRDPGAPEDGRGRWRLHPLLLVLGLVFLAAAAVFIYMTLTN